MKKNLFVKVNNCSDEDITELFRISKVFGVTIIALLKRKFVNRIEIVRGGNVAIESVGISDRLIRNI